MATAGLRRTWTPDDLVDLPADGKRYEIVDGELRVSPGPTWQHNTVAFKVARQLEPALPHGVVVLTPAGGIAVPRGLVIPDLAVVDDVLANSRSHQGDPAHVHLVLEVASPSSAIDDIAEKAALYAEAGIPSYWRVELEPELRLVTMELADIGYVSVDAGRRVTVSRPCRVTVEL